MTKDILSGSPQEEPVERRRYMHDDTPGLTYGDEPEGSAEVVSHDALPSTPFIEQQAVVRANIAAFLDTSFSFATLGPDNESVVTRVPGYVHDVELIRVFPESPAQAGGASLTPKE